MVDAGTARRHQPGPRWMDDVAYPARACPPGYISVIGLAGSTSHPRRFSGTDRAGLMPATVDATCRGCSR